MARFASATRKRPQMGAAQGLPTGEPEPYRAAPPASSRLVRACNSGRHTVHERYMQRRNPHSAPNKKAPHLQGFFVYRGDRI
jgi:hypothetical protein